MINYSLFMKVTVNFIIFYFFKLNSYHNLDIKFTYNSSNIKKNNTIMLSRVHCIQIGILSLHFLLNSEQPIEVLEYHTLA